MAKNHMLEKTKVLLIEDDPMVVRMYKRKLLSDGFDLNLAFNGEEGLAALKKDRPDIVLLDIMMPKVNGFETLKAIKSDPQYKDLPVVILTNLGDRDEDIEQSKRMGAEDYWVKANLDLNEMKNLIDKILSKGLTPEK